MKTKQLKSIDSKKPLKTEMSEIAYGIDKSRVLMSLFHQISFLLVTFLLPFTYRFFQTEVNFVRLEYS